jgi:putative methyltransferase (TIGR04325 family)
MPPFVYVFIRWSVQLISKKNLYIGPYKNWHEAKKNAIGYDHPSILNNALKATLSVQSGLYPYERDSVVFDEVQYSHHILIGLMIMLSKTNTLNIIDFGGALGSSYFQNIHLLKMFTHCTWSVIEQENYVEAGKKHIHQEFLHFYHTIESCVNDQNKPNIVLLSSVLQYLDQSYTILDTLLHLKPDVIVIGNTPILNSDTDDMFFVQNVPTRIYDASYPVCFFNYTKLITKIKELGYIQLENFKSPLGSPSTMATWYSFVFVKQ